MREIKRALLVIDMQYDFMEEGSLAVKNANELLGPINDLMNLHWDLIVASKDWHPDNHISFASSHQGKKAFEEITLDDGNKQVLWPAHCIKGTRGADIHQGLNKSVIKEIVLKGQNPNIDSYSAFFDNNHLEKTELDNILKAHTITDIYIVGLAGDYCVKFTAIDGQKLGYRTYFVSDATKLVNPDEGILLLEELNKANVTIIKIDDIN